MSVCHVTRTPPRPLPQLRPCWMLHVVFNRLLSWCFYAGTGRTGPAGLCGSKAGEGEEGAGASKGGEPLQKAGRGVKHGAVTTLTPGHGLRTGFTIWNKSTKVTLGEFNLIYKLFSFVWLSCFKFGAINNTKRRQCFTWARAELTFPPFQYRWHLVSVFIRCGGWNW